jgi:competence protein ComEA
MSSSLLLVTFLASLALAGQFRPACPGPPDPGAARAAGSARVVAAPVAAGSGTPQAAGAPVPVNTAGIDALCTLPGIGPARAQAIVAARQRRPFARLSDLARVKGLGPRRIQALAGRVVFD